MRDLQRGTVTPNLAGSSGYGPLPTFFLVIGHGLTWLFSPLRPGDGLSAVLRKQIARLFAASLLFLALVLIDALVRIGYERAFPGRRGGF